MRQVSVIIVSYNTKHLLSDCIESIMAHTADIDFEIIVVDNNSNDGSEEYIKTAYPNVIWLNSGGNIGFGRANNLGAKHSQGEYLFFLNSDTVLKNNALRYFTEHMRTHETKNIGILGGYLYDEQGGINFSYGDFPSPASEIKYIVGKIFRKKRHYDITNNRAVDWISGADMFMRRCVFEDIGGFDPAIFMYYEDTDLQYRLFKAGYRQYIIADPEIVHLESGSSGGKGLTYRKFIMSQTSYNHYIRKHFHGIRYVAYRLFMCLYRLTIFITADWNLGEKISAYKLVLFGK